MKKTQRCLLLLERPQMWGTGDSKHGDWVGRLHLCSWRWDTREKRRNREVERTSRN